ncbi:DUF1684 domain-containing protein [Arthrobacter sp. H20]|uniref:DUF1684 domain-containing protein n=1 Tax=Arthrobacter sp. H20 TaxID=1267981 RepID=UPI0004B8090D|nr:DUF1684 domain-containing protein [Arthrobacter sp. H20]
MTHLTPAQHRDSEQWRSFRKRRDTSLAVGHGWLTLTSLQWLPTDPSALDLVPGQWSASEPGSAPGATLTARAEDGLTLVHTGEPVDGTLKLELADGASKNWVRYQDTVVELAVRGNRYVVRTRDNHAPTLTGFDGVPVFEYDPGAVIDGSYTPYPTPRAIPIGTAQPEVTDVIHATGTVSFSLRGRFHTLAAEQQHDGSLRVAFHDETNERDTAQWRFLVTDHVSPTGQVTLDFNRSLNYPSAFTPFGTCPRPVAGNHIEAPVEAGERQPVGLARPPSSRPVPGATPLR